LPISEKNKKRLERFTLEEFAMCADTHETDNWICLVWQVENEDIYCAVGKMKVNVAVVVAAAFA
jgi:hypothetical protein